MMTSLLHHEPSTPAQRVTPLRTAGLQRRCSCGGVAGPDGECAACRAKRLSMQRRDPHAGTRAQAPPEVSQVLQSPGEGIPDSTRAMLESRLGHSFRHVRIHRDSRASATADMLGALAYTVGHHVVFAPGQFAPGTSAGHHLLAHELAHVRQQSAPGSSSSSPGGTIPILPPDTAHEREAEHVARSSASTASSAGNHSGIPGNQPTGLARQPAPEADAWLQLRFEESGRIQATVSGPGMPVIGQPTLGIRRNPGGTYEMVFGNRKNVLAPSDVPDLLRGSLKGPTPAPPPAVRAPSCEALRAPSGSRFMTYDEYRISQMLSPTLLPMTAPIYEARVAGCRSVAAEPPAQASQAPAAPAPEPVATPATPAEPGGEPTPPE